LDYRSVYFWKCVANGNFTCVGEGSGHSITMMIRLTMKNNR